MGDERVTAEEFEERVKHNKLTNGGEVHEGEVQEQCDEHDRRTAGISDETAQ